MLTEAKLRELLEVAYFKGAMYGIERTRANSGIRADVAVETKGFTENQARVVNQLMQEADKS